MYTHSQNFYIHKLLIIKNFGTKNNTRNINYRLTVENNRLPNN